MRALPLTLTSNGSQPSLTDPVQGRRPSPTIAWIEAVVYALVIFATLPVAPYITDFFERLFGNEEAIGGVATVLLALIGAWALVRVVRQVRAAGAANFVWLMAIAAAYAALLARMEVPAEKVHFLEYGFLGLGCYRAWRRSDRDAITPFAALLVAYTIGLVDESVQFLSPWHTWWGFPKRTGEIQDAVTNLWAIGLAQLLAWRILDPSASRIVPSPRSVRHLGSAAAVAAAATCVFILWTAEFGYRYSDPVAGTFYSRLTLEELRRIDTEEGRERGAILDRHRETPYGEFVNKLYTALDDPHMHEVRVHIFRRDRYLRKRNGAIVDPAKADQAHHFGVVSQREDDILRTYFPQTLAASGQALPDEWRAWLDQSDQALGHPPYASAVSNRIIVSFTRIHVALVLPIGLLVIALSTVVGARAATARRERAPTK